MARVGIIFGLLLCGVTVAGLVDNLQKTPTQFFPMMLGIPILFCGVVALNPHRRRHAMTAAMTIAGLGLSVGALRIATMGFRWMTAQPVSGLRLQITLAMTAVCLVFAVACWRPLRAAWRVRVSPLPGAGTKAVLPSATEEKKQSELGATETGLD